MTFIQFLKTGKELRFSVNGKLVGPAHNEAEAKPEEEEEEGLGEVNGEILEVKEEENMEWSVPTSLSSSLIVSSTLAVLRRITVTNCGGATSVMNLASREVAIMVVESLVIWKMEEIGDEWIDGPSLRGGFIV